MHYLFMVENFSRALGRGGEMKGDVRILFHHCFLHLESGPPAGPGYPHRPPGTDRPFFVARPEWDKERTHLFLLNPPQPYFCCPERPRALPHPRKLGKGWGWIIKSVGGTGPRAGYEFRPGAESSKQVLTALILEKQVLSPFPFHLSSFPPHLP